MAHKPSPSKRKSLLQFKVNLFKCMLLITALAFLSVLASSAMAGSKKGSVNVSVLENTTDRTVIHYNFGEFVQQQITINSQTYNAIFVEGESNKKEVSAPALPDVSRSIIISDDALMQVNVLDSSYYEIEDFDIVPSKGYISREINPADVPYTFSNVYQSNAFYPGPLAQLGEPYIMRDHRGVVLTVNSFQYNPIQRILRVYTEMTVEVTAVDLGKINILQRDSRTRKLSRAFHTIYSAHFINYNLTERYETLDEEGELLIIVHDAWNSNVQPLKTHKDSIGINTTIQNVSTIPGGGNLDTAIKAYIQGIYDDPTRDLAFVLLVGDLAHIDSFTAVSGYNGESDPKYSKLGGSDDYPDIIVGRLSAESAADVDTQVERIIEYETMPAGSQSWFWQGTGIASDDGSGNGDDSEWDWEHIRNIRADLLSYDYTQVDELYEGSQGGGDAAGNPTDTMVSTSVNAGRGIINYCGHGGTTNWSTTGFNNADVNALTNDNMLPFIFDVACLNGNFGETTCFAEAWMRATNGSEPTGAIGIYASSINQPWTPPMEAQDEFNLLYVAESYNSYGAYCYAAACSMMDDYPGNGETWGNGHATFNTWHIFGDPTLRITGAVDADVILVDDIVFGEDSVIRDVCNQMDYLILKFTAGYYYYDILDEFGPGGDFEGWQVASEADLNLLGNCAGIVHGSTDPGILAKAEQLRDWFGNVRISSTHIVARALISDTVVVGEDIHQKAFSIGRRINVMPNEVDFRVSGWGPIYSDESTFLVRSGSSTVGLVYTPVSPCRIADTRISQGGSGPITGGTQRSFYAAGLCGVPFGPAKAIMINITAVNATGTGHLRAFAYPELKPFAATLSFGAVPQLGQGIANAAIVPICDTAASSCSYDLSIWVSKTTDVVVDVMGYFAP